MRKVFYFIGCVTVTVILMILYIYQNIQLIQASYRIRQKEERLAEVSDVYKKLVCEINALHSPAYLEGKMMQQGVKLVQPTNIKLLEQVVHIQPTLFAENVHARRPVNLLNTIMPEAHAHTTES